MPTCRGPGTSAVLADVTLREHGQNVPAGELDLFPASLVVEVARCLVQAGVRRMEVISCVSPIRAPAMSPERIRAIARGVGSPPGLTLVTLVPNLRGFESFLELGLGPRPGGLGHHAGLLVSAVEEHNRLNLGQSIRDSLDACRLVASRAHLEGVPLVAYVSAAFGYAPSPGECVDVQGEHLAHLVESLRALGAETVTLSDLQGVRSPEETRHRLGELMAGLGEDASTWLGYHPHHREPEAGVELAKAAFDAGVRLFDGSLGAVGGCITGAPGNAPTEGLLSMLTAAGAFTGIDPVALGEASQAFSRSLGRTRSGPL